MSEPKAKRNNIKDIKPQFRYLHPDLIKVCVQPIEGYRMHYLFKAKISKHLKDLLLGAATNIALNHSDALAQCAYGMMAGALKYDPWNFLNGFTTSDILDSLERHTYEYLRNPDAIDPDASQILKKGYGDNAPSIYHYGLILTNINMYLWLTLNGGLVEDRGYILWEQKHNESK